MLNYILDELKKIMAIDSPSGFTRKAADWYPKSRATEGLS